MLFFCLISQRAKGTWGRSSEEQRGTVLSLSAVLSATQGPNLGLRGVSILQAITHIHISAPFFHKCINSGLTAGLAWLYVVQWLMVLLSFSFSFSIFYSGTVHFAFAFYMRRNFGCIYT